MAAATLLDFRNSQILLADGVQRAELHHLAKFHQNLSIFCRDIAIFRFLKMAAVCHVGFVWDTFGPVFITVQNLVAIDAVVSKI